MPPKKDLKVIIICMKMDIKYGLSKDAEILETALKERAAKAGDINLLIHHVDPRTAQWGWADVAFHIEVPCRIAIPFARKHYFMVNPEWYYTAAWKWTLSVANATFIQRYPKALAELGAPASSVFTWLWRAPNVMAPPVKKIRQRTFVCFLGASKHKLEAALEIVPIWPPTAPLLKIWGSPDSITKLGAAAAGKANVKLSNEYITSEEVLKTLSDSEFCLLPSQAEGFGYALTDAMLTGCLPLWSDVPAYCTFLDDLMGSNGQILGTVSKEESEMLVKPRLLKPHTLETAIRLLLEMPMDDVFATRNRLIAAVNDRTAIFRQHATLLWNTMLRDLEKIPASPGCGAPPQLPPVDDVLPRVGVVTLTWNRPHWLKLAFKNILAQNWPLDRLVWCVVDDGSFDKRVDQSVVKFAEQNPKLKIEYVSIGKKTHIGGKRNRGIRRILENFPDTAYFCMMDDDDVYFPNSVRDRVSWLSSSKKGACYSSILPMYDLGTYTSTVNVPPLNLGPAKRCSEASMAFTTEFFKAKEFPSTISMAEGEGFFAGREEETVEVPPQGIIVSLLHAQNTSSRGFTATKDNKDSQNGCHYGFSDEFFLFLHGLGQTSVTEAAAAAASAAEAAAKAKAKEIWLAQQKEEQALKNSSEPPVPSGQVAVASEPVTAVQETSAVPSN